MIDSASQVVDDHIRRSAELAREREPWKPLWQDITDYVLPRRSFWDIETTSGQVPSTKCYDGTAIADLQLLVDGMQGNLVSPSFAWLRLVMEDRRLQDLPGVADYLEFVEEIFLAYYQRTAFYEAMNEFLMDLASIGTAIMLVEDDIRNRSITFSTRHMKECYIAENRNGQVDVLYRLYTLPNRQIVETWPERVDDRRREATKTNPFAKGHILHAVFPSSDESFRTLRKPQHPFTSIYIDVDMKTPLDDGGYETFPYLVGRWRKNSDEVYGRSPAADAIQDILRVNQMAKSLLQSAQLANQPPLMVPEAMRGKERIVPQGYNYYTNPAEKIETIDVARNYPIGRDQEEAVRQQIHEIFRSKIFLLMQQLEHGPYTATEIRQRVAEQAAVLGSIIGRFNSEVLVPLVRRTFQILQANGSLPPTPPAIAQGGRIKIELLGPLAQAQRRVHQSQGVEAGLEFLERLVKLAPEAMDNVDEDELARIGMDSSGMPQRIIRELPDVEMKRKRRADTLARQAAAQQQAAEDALVTENVDNLNQTVKPGSILEAIGKQAGQRRIAAPAAPQGAVPGAS